VTRDERPAERLDDEAFVSAFEACTFPPARFDHEAHVRLTWIYLQREEPAAALLKVTSGLRRYTASAGVAAKYHQTITWAFVAVIAERLERAGRDLPWPRFAESNPDLFSSDLLKALYPDGVLDSAVARRVFVLPGSPS